MHWFIGIRGKINWDCNICFLDLGTTQSRVNTTPQTRNRSSACTCATSTSWSTSWSLWRESPWTTSTGVYGRFISNKFNYFRWGLICFLESSGICLYYAWIFFNNFSYIALVNNLNFFTYSETPDFGLLKWLVTQKYNFFVGYAKRCPNITIFVIIKMRSTFPDMNWSQDSKNVFWSQIPKMYLSFFCYH